MLTLKGARPLQMRASPLLLDISLDGQTLKELFQMPDRTCFGANDGGATPLRHRVQDIVQSRYLGVMLLKERESLHLAQVEVYAVPI